MGVDLRGPDAGMSQQLLHKPQIHAVLQNVCRERMPEQVRVQILVRPQKRLKPLDDPPDRFTRQPGPPAAHEYIIRLAHAALLRQIRPKNIRRLLSHRHHTLLLSLAEAPHISHVQVHVDQSQTRHLGGPQPACVQQLQHRPVSQARAGLIVNRVQKLLHFALGQHLRQRPAHLRRHHIPGKILADPVLLEQILQKHPHARSQPRHRRRRQSLPSRGLDEFEDMLPPQLVRIVDSPLPRVRREPPQIPPVRPNRVQRRAELDLHRVQKIINGVLHACIDRPGWLVARVEAATALPVMYN